MTKKMIFIVVAVVLVGGAWLYFKSPDAVAPGEVAFETVKKDFHSGVEAVTNAAISGEAEWIALWSQMSANVIPKPPAPAIDFSKETVVAVLMGAKPTGGYSTEITKIVESADRITVYTQETWPGPNCAVTAALTSPYHIVKIAKSSKQFDFSVTKDITECQLP